MDKIGQEAGKSYAYLLGVFLGDGCVTTQGGRLVFKLNTIDQDFAEAVKVAIEDCGGKAAIYKYEVKKSIKPNHSLWCGDVQLCQRLLDSTGGRGRYKSVLPEFLSAECQKALIVGLMDSEGFVAKNTGRNTGRAYYMGYKSCDVWVDRLKSLMQSVGLKLGKTGREKPRKPWYKTPTRFHIKMQSWVDSGMRFNIKRKQERVDRWAATEPYSERSRYPRKLTPETLCQTPL
jgi:hypothetical protein